VARDGGAREGVHGRPRGADAAVPQAVLGVRRLVAHGDGAAGQRLGVHPAHRGGQRAGGAGRAALADTTSYMYECSVATVSSTTMSIYAGVGEPINTAPLDSLFGFAVSVGIKPVVEITRWRSTAGCGSTRTAGRRARRCSTTATPRRCRCRHRGLMPPLTRATAVGTRKRAAGQGERASSGRQVRRGGGSQLASGGVART